jgi:hypothetical protein
MAIRIEWDRERRQYRAQNQSGRVVRVAFPAWPSTIEVVLKPYDTCFVSIAEFELPYRADYAD